MLQGVIAILIADAGVQAAVGKDKRNQDYKVYPVACPQPEDDPYLVLAIVEGSIFQRCKDSLGDEDNTPFSVFAYHKSYAGADNLLSVIRNALDNYSGTINSVKFKRIYFDDYRDGWDKDSGDGLFVKVGTFRAIVDASPST